jgi:TolA-binding protein
MGWVSKSEDDQEALDFKSALSGFTAVSVNPKAAERDRLKTEIYNLKEYKQVVEFLLRSARKQIKKLEDEIRELHQRLAQSQSTNQGEQRLAQKRLLELQTESESQLRALEGKLNEYQFKEFAQLYRRSEPPTLEKKFGESSVRNSSTKSKSSTALNPVIPPGIKIG